LGTERGNNRLLLFFAADDYRLFLDCLWQAKMNRQATQRGCLIGRETFEKQVEAMTGRRLIDEARGRPKKTAPTTIEKVL